MKKRWIGLLIFLGLVVVLFLNKEEVIGVKLGSDEYKLAILKYMEDNFPIQGSVEIIDTVIVKEIDSAFALVSVNDYQLGYIYLRKGKNDRYNIERSTSTGRLNEDSFYENDVFPSSGKGQYVVVYGKNMSSTFSQLYFENEKTGKRFIYYSADEDLKKQELQLFVKKIPKEIYEDGGFIGEQILVKK